MVRETTQFPEQVFPKKRCTFQFQTKIWAKWKRLVESNKPSDTKIRKFEKKPKHPNYHQLPSNIFKLHRLKDFKINGSIRDPERDRIWYYSIWDYRIYVAYIVYYFSLSNQEWEDVRIFGRWNLCQGC